MGIRDIWKDFLNVFRNKKEFEVDLDSTEELSEELIAALEEANRKAEKYDKSVEEGVTLDSSDPGAKGVDKNTIEIRNNMELNNNVTRTSDKARTKKRVKSDNSEEIERE